LVLLLWLVVLGLPVAGWFYGFPLLMDREQRLTTLEERIAGLASSADTQAQVSRQLDQVLQPLDRRIEDALRQVQEGQRQLNADAARQRSSIAAAEAEVRDQLRRYDERFVRLDERLSRLTATDRRAWLVAESAFMVRLAGQRLAAARDVESALALLRTADDLLLEADDPLLDAARRAIAVDVAALRALPVVDIIGIDARINALLEQTGALSLIKPAPTLQMSDEGSFLERAKAGWEAALAKLSDYLVIRRRSDELASMLTPEWVTLARQNLRMLLEQAQIAMLSANRELYDRSLERAEAFAGLFVENDPERVAAMTAELRALRDMPIARDLPDLVDSRRALSEASRQLSPEVEG
jgi:uroporphyrin-3 C-methyltransferase